MAPHIDHNAEARVTRTAGSARSLSIVIPAFNEVKRLPRTVQAIHGFLLERGYDGEILVVNDGSSDGTAEAMALLERTLPLLRTITHTQNSGKGFAVKTGMLAATRKAILFCDADHSTPISDLDRFWPSFDDGVQVVIGSRALADSEIFARQPWYRELTGTLFNRIIRLLGVGNIRMIHDTQCGFKLFESNAAKAIFSKLRTNGFAFDVEVLMHASRLGLRVAEVPVHWGNEPDSRVRLIRDSTKMLLEIIRMLQIV